MSNEDIPEMDMNEHRGTYDLFIHMTIGTIVGCIILLICLAGIGVGNAATWWVGILGLFAGTAAVSLSLFARLSYMPAYVVTGVIVLLMIVSL